MISFTVFKTVEFPHFKVLFIIVIYFSKAQHCRMTCHHLNQLLVLSTVESTSIWHHRPSFSGLLPVLFEELMLGRSEGSARGVRAEPRCSCQVEVCARLCQTDFGISTHIDIHRATTILPRNNEKEHWRTFLYYFLYNNFRKSSSYKL